MGAWVPACVRLNSEWNRPESKRLLTIPTTGSPSHSFEASQKASSTSVMGTPTPRRCFKMARAPGAKPEKTTHLKHSSDAVNVCLKHHKLKKQVKNRKKFSLTNRIKAHLKSLTYKEVTQMIVEKKMLLWKTDDDDLNSPQKNSCKGLVNVNPSSVVQN